MRQFGTDSVRWWLLGEVPRVGDADFTVARLIARANADLAGGLGNLVSRTVAMVHRYRGGVVPGDVVPGEGADLGGTDPGGGEGWAGDPGAGRLLAACEQAPGLVDAALSGFDFRAAADAIWDIVDAANRYIEDVRPWQLARSQRNPEAGRLDAALALLVHACRCLAGSSPRSCPAPRPGWPRNTRRGSPRSTAGGRAGLSPAGHRVMDQRRRSRYGSAAFPAASPSHSARMFALAEEAGKGTLHGFAPVWMNER